MLSGLDTCDPQVDEARLGPALLVIKQSDRVGAIAIANDSPKGFSGSFCSIDIELAREVAGHLHCNSVWISARRQTYSAPS